jgi:hypothetical protein
MRDYEKLVSSQEAAEILARLDEIIFLVRSYQDSMGLVKDPKHYAKWLKYRCEWLGGPWLNFYANGNWNPGEQYTEDFDRA